MPVDAFPGTAYPPARVGESGWRRGVSVFDCIPGRSIFPPGSGRRLLFALWIGTALGVGGCATTGRNAGAAELAPSAQPYELDIPLPQGFALVDRSSESWSSGAIRYLRHRYVGRADKYAIRKFYRQQMPLVRWTALAESQVRGRYTLRFERAEESCTIVVADSGLRPFQRAVVDVIIGPTARHE